MRNDEKKKNELPLPINRDGSESVLKCDAPLLVLVVLVLLVDPVLVLPAQSRDDVRGGGGQLPVQGDEGHPEEEAQAATDLTDQAVQVVDEGLPARKIAT